MDRKLDSNGRLKMSDEYFSPEKYIGKTVILPDGGVGKICAISVTGEWRRVEWCINYWYSGSRNIVWVEPNEVQLKD